MLVLLVLFGQVRDRVADVAEAERFLLLPGRSSESTSTSSHVQKRKFCSKFEVTLKLPLISLKSKEGDGLKFSWSLLTSLVPFFWISVSGR